MKFTALLSLLPLLVSVSLEGVIAAPTEPLAAQIGPAIHYPFQPDLVGDVLHVSTHSYEKRLYRETYYVDLFDKNYMWVLIEDDKNGTMAVSTRWEHRAMLAQGGPSFSSAAPKSSSASASVSRSAISTANSSVGTPRPSSASSKAAVAPSSSAPKSSASASAPKSSASASASASKPAAAASSSAPKSSASSSAPKSSASSSAPKASASSSAPKSSASASKPAAAPSSSAPKSSASAPSSSKSAAAASSSAPKSSASASKPASSSASAPKSSAPASAPKSSASSNSVSASKAAAVASSSAPKSSASSASASKPAASASSAAPKPSFSSSSTAPKPSSTSSSAAPSAAVSGSTSASAGVSAADQAKFLTLHNDFRAKYSANPVVWDQTLANYALKTAQSCKYGHTGGPYGENIAAGVGGGYNIDKAFNSWANEDALYDFNKPGYSSATGHFTAIVWKGTTKVGCAAASCPDGSIFTGYKANSTYVVCNYQTPGNIVSSDPARTAELFRTNVGPKK